MVASRCATLAIPAVDLTPCRSRLLHGVDCILYCNSGWRRNTSAGAVCNTACAHRLAHRSRPAPSPLPPSSSRFLRDASIKPVVRMLPRLNHTDPPTPTHHHHHPHPHTAASEMPPPLRSNPDGRCCSPTTSSTPSRSPPLPRSGNERRRCDTTPTAPTQTISRHRNPLLPVDP